MGLEHTKWWHWVLISLLMGWALAYLNSGPVEPLSRLDEDGPGFERSVLRPPANDGQTPWVRNLVVYPAIVTRDSSGSTLQVMPVLFDELVHKQGGGAGEFQYQPAWFCSRVPYLTLAMRPAFPAGDPRAADVGKHLPPGIKRYFPPDPKDTLSTITVAVYGKDTPEGEAAISTCNQMFRRSLSIQKLIDDHRFTAGRSILIPPDPNSEPMSVRDWLVQAQSFYPWIQYKYAWWRDPRYTNYVWMGSTFLIVGVIWPILLAVMGKAGLGGRDLAMKSYDMSKYGTGKPEPKPAAKPKRELSEAGREQLAAMNQSLMSELEESATHGGGAQPAVPAAKPAAGKEFVAAPAGPVAAPAAKVEEERDFSGEFYPVAHPKGKPEEPDKK